MPIGDVVSYKLSPETLRRFVDSLNRFKKFACMQIEGHKALWTMTDNETIGNVMNDEQFPL
jgi:hypothetical protein